jgi:isopenicillin-N epimerase
MAIAPLTAVADLSHLKTQLLAEFQVEIPLIQWHKNQFVRISVQGYNTQADIDHLILALETLLPQHSVLPFYEA